MVVVGSYFFLKGRLSAPLGDDSMVLFILFLGRSVNLGFVYQLVRSTCGIAVLDAIR